MKTKINSFAVTLLFTSAIITASAEVHYVDLNSTNATPPYQNWATAASNIQDAVDAAVAGDEVIVTNGAAYRSVSVDIPIDVRSVNGPQSTTIQGFGRCAYLTNGASLAGFTLTGGSADVGGGVYGGTLNNCMLIGNRAYNGCDTSSSGNGGGAAYCTLNNCALVGNSAVLSSFNGCLLGLPGQFQLPRGGDFGDGGGAYYCTLNNCTLVHNSANNYFEFCYFNSFDFGHYGDGGGAAYCTLRNCILADNSAGNHITCNFDPVFSDFGDYGRGQAAYRSSLLNCILSDYPGADALFLSGGGWWRTDPAFDSSQGGYRLGTNSPCINAGYNAFAPVGPDLDGNPRIVGGTVDIGAYEFQAPLSKISYAWLQAYGLPINAATDTADPDGDGVDNYYEWLAGTDPTNRFSSPAQLALFASGTNILVTWSTNAVGFMLQSTTNLDSAAVWSTNCLVPVLVGDHNVVTNRAPARQQFYRLIR